MTIPEIGPVKERYMGDAPPSEKLSTWQLMLQDDSIPLSITTMNV